MDDSDGSLSDTSRLIVGNSSKVVDAVADDLLFKSVVETVAAAAIDDCFSDTARLASHH